MLRYPRNRRLIPVATALTMAMALSGTPALAATGTPSAAPAKHAEAPAQTAALTQDQALKQAQSSGKAVAIPADETPTSSLTANPGGSLTLTSYAQPVRKEVGGSWHPLDATLKKNPDGTFSPTLSASPLTLSGGGTAPLVTMRSGADSMSLSLPVALPAPKITGDEATYRNVIPDVDLVITATDQGGFTDVYVVHTAAAAANPKLADLLTTTTRTTGLHLGVDASGTVHADDARGREIFTAPAATMWDSSTSASPTGTPAAAAAKAARIPATASSIASPGSRAHQARLGVHVSGDNLTLTPDPALLTAKSPQLPLYIDPPWSAYSNGGWATVAENYPTQSYWDTSAESEDLMQVGMSPSGFWADSLINFEIPTGELYNGGTPKFESAYFYASNYSTDNPNTSTADVYAPSATLTSSNANWDDWFTSSRNLGSAIGSASFAQDVSKSVGFPISTGWISQSTSEQTIALAGDSYSDEESNDALYKVFYNPTASSGTTAPSIALTFTHAPTVFDLSTSPNKALIGDGNVALNADVSDVDGGTLSVAFDAYITGDTSEVIKSGTASTGAGAAASMWIYQPTLDTDIVSSAFGNKSTTTSMSISWSVTVSNGNGQSATSPVKTFTYSTAAPGAPGVYTDSGYDYACNDSESLASPPSYTIGTPATFYLKPSTSDLPSTYTYQLNGGQPISVPAGTDAETHISVTPTSQLNVLTVDAVGTDGNIGQAARCLLNAAGAPNAAPDNLSGGQNPDLLVTGTGSSTLPSGLWLAPGSANGQINGDAVNIGVDGTGQSATDASATTYNGTQSITGLFQGSGFNDVLVYNPTLATTNEECSGQLIVTLGNGLPLDPNWSSEVNGNVFTLNDGEPSAECATSVANGGNLYLAEADDPSSTAPATSVDTIADGAAPFPDLLVVVGGSLYLEPSSHNPGGYPGLVSSIDLSDTNPSGTGTWAGWSITTIDTSGDIPYLFAVDQSTGAVYYYSSTALAGLAWNAMTGSSSAADSPSEPAKSGYGTGTYTQIQATAVNGTPALWATATTGTTSTTSTFELNSAGTGLTQSGSATNVTVTSHAWSLNDGSTSAQDASASPLNLTASGSVAANTGDLFSPDIDFTTGVNGTMTTTQAGMTLTKSFTISLWADPEVNGMTAVSQDGTSYPGMMLYPTPSGWDFYLAKDNGASEGDGDSVTGGTVELGTWSHIQATFNATTHVMSLYVDDTFVAYGSHTAPTTGATGPLRLGANIDDGKFTNYFTGQLAQLGTVAGQAEAPTQFYTPASYHQSISPERILDTRQDATNTYSGMPETDTPLASDATLAVSIVGDKVTPTVSGAPATIPNTATAVAIDVTVTSESGNGELTTYADGTERPITSSTNYSPSTTVTGYQIVPIGRDGKISLYNSSGGTTHVLIDLTGYFTSDASLTGDQTLHAVSPAYRDFNTATATTDTTLTSSGVVAAGTTFNVSVTGVDGIPANATAVAINLTTSDESGSGYLEAYPAGATAPAALTNLTYQTNNVASMDADVPLGTNGQITVSNQGSSSTDIIGDISGYYTTDTSGLAYHTVNPTRLVDTRSGVGNTTSTIAPVASDGTYTVQATDTAQLTTATNPILATVLTATDQTEPGYLVAYPDAATKPGTSNLNWTSTTPIANANLAITPEGTDGAIDVYNGSTGTSDIIVDASGYFANDAGYAPNHDWPLTDGSGSSTAEDTVGGSPLSLTGTYTWPSANINTTSISTVLGLDGTSAYGAASGPALDTADSFSVSAWAELTTVTTGTFPTVVAQSGNQAAGFYLQYNGDWNGWCLNFIATDTANAAGDPDVPCSSTAPTAGTWYHLVGTYDAASKTASLYVNGTLATSVTGITPWNATGDLTVGAGQYNATIDNLFPGQISTVETFNYALTASQVGQLYQQAN